MRQIIILAAVAALIAACGEMGAGADTNATADTPATEAVTGEVDAASTEPEVAPAVAAADENFTLTIEDPKVSQIEGFWWDDGRLYETFRKGRYTAFRKQDLGLATNQTYVAVVSCDDQTPDANGQGMAMADRTCFLNSSVVDNKFTLISGGSTFTETLVTGDMVQTLETAYAAVSAQ